MGRPPRGLRRNINDEHCEWDGTLATYNESAGVATQADADQRQALNSMRSLSTHPDINLVEDTAEFPWTAPGAHSWDLSTDTGANFMSPMSSDLAEFISM
jgi:hypothetical protein